jgi:hypothetical protein
VKANLRKALLRIAQDARAKGQSCHEGVRAPGRPINVTADVGTDAEQASFGAFVVASDWHHKLLSSFPPALPTYNG